MNNCRKGIVERSQKKKKCCCATRLDSDCDRSICDSATHHQNTHFPMLLFRRSRHGSLCRLLPEDDCGGLESQVQVERHVRRMLGVPNKCVPFYDAHTPYTSPFAASTVKYSNQQRIRSLSHSDVSTSFKRNFMHWISTEDT